MSYCVFESIFKDNEVKCVNNNNKGKRSVALNDLTKHGITAQLLN